MKNNSFTTKLWLCIDTSLGEQCPTPHIVIFALTARITSSPGILVHSVRCLQLSAFASFGVYCSSMVFADANWDQQVEPRLVHYAGFRVKNFMLEKDISSLW